MNAYVMGIDNGGTGTKAVLFDLTGREIAGAKRSTPMLSPQPGYTERDMDVLWDMNCEVIRETVEKSGVKPSDILGVSFTGHGKGLYLWGKDDHPVRCGIVSTDSRAHRIVEEWRADGTAEKAYARTCQSVLASQPVALIKWLQINEPESLRNTKYIFGVKDYVRFRMTGEAYGEITDLSGSSLVNLRTASYDPEILKIFGLEEISDKLPPLVYSTRFCGKVTKDCAARTGLSEGTPVAAGLFDIDACAIGMDIRDGERIAVIAGTWAINEYIAKEPVLDHSCKMNSLYALPGFYLAEECSPTSASNHEWFVDRFLSEAANATGENPYTYANRIAEAAPPERANLCFVPYLYGGCDNAAARASFVGLEARHTRADLLRAVYEGIVYSHKMQICRLQKGRAVPAKAIRLAGGVVNSPMWTQMFADILEMEVETVSVKELGALGAAMTAAVAAGVFDDLQQAADRMVRLGRKFVPDPAMRDTYRRKFERYLHVEAALRALWDTAEE